MKTLFICMFLFCLTASFGFASDNDLGEKNTICEAMREDTTRGKTKSDSTASRPRTKSSGATAQ